MWELYNVVDDFSQAVDLSRDRPDKLAELQALFHQQAEVHGVYPLRDVGSPRHGDYSVPSSLGGATRMTYTPAHVRMPESSVISLKNCSFRITAAIETNDDDHGVIVCQGGNNADQERTRRDLRNRIQEVERSLGLIQRACAQAPPRMRTSSFT